MTQLSISVCVLDFTFLSHDQPSFTSELRTRVCVVFLSLSLLSVESLVDDFDFFNAMKIDCVYRKLTCGAVGSVSTIQARNQSA